MPRSITVSKSSKASPIFEVLLALACAAALSAAAVAWFHQQGYLYYYGDAEAHLNIARRIADSRTPGPFQFGTVWLPLPHAAMALFARNDELWRNGLAGAYPAAAAFVVACGFLFASLRRVTGSRAAAWGGMAVFALNPNLLYLQSTAMTEAYLFAFLFGLLYFSLRGNAVIAGLCAAAAALCRYEGWALIPLVAVYLLWKTRKWRTALVFGAIASAGPVAWVAHNIYYYSDPLEFYEGEWSAKAIYQRSLDAGMERYPGDGNLAVAARYYAEAAVLVCGIALVLLAVIGLVGSFRKKRFWWVALLGAGPAFYVYSMYSGGTPIYVPNLWPHSYYNSRYGLALLPFLAWGAAEAVALVRGKWRLGLFAVVLAAGIAPWADGEGICWKESQVNSEVRRAWTREAADYLKEHYRGGGIAAGFGDLTGIMRQAGIPIREMVHEGNLPHWDAMMMRPELFLGEEWAVTFSGDKLATAILRADRKAFAAKGTDAAAILPRYERVKMIYIKGGPVVEIYRRAQSQP